MEIPIFDPDVHAMAMDRRPIVTIIKGLVKDVGQKNNWSQPEKKPPKISLLVENLEEEKS